MLIKIDVEQNYKESRKLVTTMKSNLTSVYEARMHKWPLIAMECDDTDKVITEVAYLA